MFTFFSAILVAFMVAALLHKSLNGSSANDFLIIQYVPSRTYFLILSVMSAPLALLGSSLFLTAVAGAVSFAFFSAYKELYL